MAKIIYSATPRGIEADIVEVEVDISPGLPATHVVGLPDTAIRESKERIRGCFKSSSFKYPIGRITVNLAPADLQKYGTQFDFSIAVGILSSSLQIDNTNYCQTIFLGELSLDGSLKKINHCLSMILEARSKGFKRVFLSYENYIEAIMVDGIDVVPLASLDDLSFYIKGKFFPLRKKTIKLLSNRKHLIDFADIKGSDFVKRGMEISAAGGHNLLMSGSPGSGKTMLAQAFNSILPELNITESIEVIKIDNKFDIVKITDDHINISLSRPFRQPHTGITIQSFIGGGAKPRPGEITLAHNGVLFMDEFPEFSKEVLESLRQPLENGYILINRVNGYYSFPARFILVAARNPCPCGFYNDSKKECLCSPSQVQKYRRKISGPILDRIDIQINVKKTESSLLLQESKESSDEIRRRVISARDVQRVRNPRGELNAYLSTKEVLTVCNLNDEGKSFLNRCEDKYGFSARVYFKIIKLSRTIADLQGSENVSLAHISEALRYKFEDY